MVGRGRGNRAAGNSTAMVAVRRLHTQLTGSKVTPSDHPKTFVEIPWNSWTYEKTATGGTQVTTVGDIQAQIRTKCSTKSADDGNQLLIKVQSACAWATAASLVYPDLTAVFYELSSSNATQQIRSQQRDKGTLQMPAKAGYSFPLADQKEILGNDDAGTTVFSAIPGETTLVTTARVHVLWQSTS